MNANAITDYDRWLEGRLQGIGASEVADVFSEPPWGCARKLAYSKRQVPQDFPVDMKLVFERGHYLEPAVVARYEAETGEAVTLRGEVISDPDAPHRRVTLDGAVFSSGHLPVVFEAKTANATEFARIKREGMRNAYVLQLQYAVGVFGAHRGVFGVLHPDSWSFIHFEQEADPSLIAMIFEAVDRAWAEIQNGPLPAQLDAKDPRCGRCPWRLTCHGDAVPLLSQEDRNADLEDAPDLATILDDYREAEDLHNVVSEALDAVKDQLRSALDGRTAVICNGAKVYHRPQVSNRISVDLVRKKYPAIADECTVGSTSQPLRVYLPKTGE